MVAGPLDLDVRFSSTASEAAIWAVISDVWPDGTAHPLTVGRLLDDYPSIDPARSLYDPVTGKLVQPYGIYGHQTPPAIGQMRQYHVEFWPVGNRFAAGHRLRLDLVGPSAASKPDLPGLDSVVAGGPQGGVLEVPLLPA
jgi:predicted acyl esterase